MLSERGKQGPLEGGLGPEAVSSREAAWDRKGAVVAPGGDVCPGSQCERRGRARGRGFLRDVYGGLHSEELGLEKMHYLRALIDVDIGEPQEEADLDAFPLVVRQYELGQAVVAPSWDDAPAFYEYDVEDRAVYYLEVDEAYVWWFLDEERRRGPSPYGEPVIYSTTDGTQAVSIDPMRLRAGLHPIGSPGIRLVRVDPGGKIPFIPGTGRILLYEESPTVGLLKRALLLVRQDAMAVGEWQQPVTYWQTRLGPGRRVCVCDPEHAAPRRSLHLRDFDPRDFNPYHPRPFHPY